MTTAKLNGKLATAAAGALEPHVPSLYATLGRRLVGIVELASVDRVEVAADEDKDRSVTLQIKHLEVADGDHEDNVRQAMRALHTQRTAQGTITEDGDVELSGETLARCAGEINAIEAARLHVLVQKQLNYARDVLRNPRLTASDLRQELTTIADTLAAGIHPDAQPTLH